MGSRARKLDRPGSLAALGIGHVGLKVDDLETSVEFYRNILGLDSRATERGVARIPSGQDSLVLHEKSLGMSGFHFGFRLDLPSKVDEWQALAQRQKHDHLRRGDGGEVSKLQD